MMTAIDQQLIKAAVENFVESFAGVSETDRA
jgi:hypothetical protein